MTEVEMKKQNLKNELIDAIYTFLNTGDTDNFDDALYDASEGLSDNDIVNDEKVANAVRDLNKEIIYQINRIGHADIEEAFADMAESLTNHRTH